MNILINTNLKLAKLLVLLFTAVAVGLLSSFYPIIFFLILVSSITGIFLIIAPYRFAAILIIFTAVSLDIVVNIEFFGFDGGSIYKLFILIFVIRVLLEKKDTINKRLFLPIIIVLSFLLTQTFLLGLYQQNVPLISSMTSFLGILSPFSLLLIKWPKHKVDNFLLLIGTLPIISSLSGLLLQGFGLWNTLGYEMASGVIRFRGLNTPAQLAELCFYSLFALIFLYNNKHDRKYILIVSLVTLILFATLTRTAIICSFLMLLYLFFVLIKKFLNGNGIYFFLLLFILLGSGFLSVYFLDSLIERTLGSLNGGEINSSGRELAWNYYLSFTEGYSMWGQGIGATTHIYETLIRGTNTQLVHFLAPHNEYIRYYLEIGIIGSLILLCLLLFLFIKTINFVEKKNVYLSLIFFAMFFLFSYFDNTLTSIQSVFPLMFILSLLNSKTNS